MGVGERRATGRLRKEALRCWGGLNCGCAAKASANNYEARTAGTRLYIVELAVKIQEEESRG
jgi:hypothetical protein